MFDRLRKRLSRRPQARRDVTVWALDDRPFAAPRDAAVLLLIEDGEPRVLRARRRLTIPDGAFFEALGERTVDLRGMDVPVERYRIIGDAELGRTDVTQEGIVPCPLALQELDVPVTPISEAGIERLREELAG